MRSPTLRAVSEGTWTIRAPRRKAGGWSVFVPRDAVESSRFRQARFDLDGGPVVLIGADEVRRVMKQWFIQHTDRSFWIARIDLERGQLNGEPVRIAYDD